MSANVRELLQMNHALLKCWKCLTRFVIIKPIACNSMQEKFIGFLFRFGFVIWLWAFLFARVPLAAIQDLFGFESRPLLLLDSLSLGLAFVAFSKVGLRPLEVFKSSVVKVGGLSFALFWAFYSLRLGIDNWILSVELLTPASTLFKHLLSSTLIPALCLPWVVTMASSGLTLPLLVGLGSLSLLFGEFSFVFIHGFDALMKLRFSFEDLNPIPAAHSSASLVILSSMFLWSVICQRSSKSRIFQVLIGLIGMFFGLLGMQLAMTKGAFLALIPLVIFLGCCLWKFFRLFGFTVFLGLSATAGVLMFGAMRRGLWSAGSIGDRFELIRQSLMVWSDDWFLGVGFRAQGILHANSLTVSNHWYPHNFVAESLLLGGIVLMALLGYFIVSVGFNASFSITATGFKDSLHTSLTFLWIQGLASSLVSGHLALIPGLWVGGLLVLLNRYQ